MTEIELRTAARAFAAGMATNEVLPANPTAVEEDILAEERVACGYLFATTAAAKARLAEARETWRNPEWEARDRTERRAATEAGLLPPGEE